MLMLICYKDLMLLRMDFEEFFKRGFKIMCLVKVIIILFIERDKRFSV